MPVAEAVVESRLISEPVMVAPAPPMEPEVQSQSVPRRHLFAKKSEATNREQQIHPIKSEPEMQFSEVDPMPEEDFDLEHQLGQEARVLASVAQESNFRPEWRRQQPSAANKILRRIGAGLFMLVALLGTGLKNILSLVLPRSSGHTSRQAGAHVYRHQSSPIPWTLLRNIAIAIPLLVAIVVGVRYLQKGRMLEAEYTEFVTTAQNKFQQAQAIAAANPSTAIGLMDEAEVA